MDCVPIVHGDGDPRRAESCELMTRLIETVKSWL